MQGPIRAELSFEELVMRAVKFARELSQADAEVRAPVPGRRH